MAVTQHSILVEVLPFSTRHLLHHERRESVRGRRLDRLRDPKNLYYSRDFGKLSMRFEQRGNSYLRIEGRKINFTPADEV
jgi:hypothetical protein